MVSLSPYTISSQTNSTYSLTYTQTLFPFAQKVGNKRVTKTKENKTTGLPTQKCGARAIGESVSRDFGADGVFTGTITAFRREGGTHLYTVEYSDGDVKDLDMEEYNHAYEMWLRQTGWEPEDQPINFDATSGLKRKPKKLGELQGNELKKLLTSLGVCNGRHVSWHEL